MISFKKLLAKIQESAANSASSQALAVSSDTGKAPGKGAVLPTAKATTTTTTQQTQKHEHDNDDMKYVKDNINHTKKLIKLTADRITNHYKNHK